MVSNRKNKILSKNLKYFTLSDLIPIYIDVNSGDASIFPNLPEELLGPAIESLENFQKQLNCEIEEKGDVVLFEELKDITPSELLALYTKSVKGNEYYFETIDANVRGLTIFWLEELFYSVVGEHGIFSKTIDLERRIFDGYIDFAGGKRLTTLLEEKPDVENVDYYFEKENVFIELKILKTDFFESHKSKIDSATSEWRCKTKITGDMMLGRDRTYPKELLHKHLLVIREPLEKITNKANRQIKMSKVLLNKKDAKGLIIFLVDGFYSLSPGLTIRLINDPIQRHFSAVDGFIYMNLRRKIIIPQLDRNHPFFIFHAKLRPEFPKELDTFIDNLGKKWWQYLEKLSGKKIGPKASGNLETLNTAVWENYTS